MEKKEIFGCERGTIIALSANRITEEFAGIDTAMSFISSLYHIAFCLENRVKKNFFMRKAKVARKLVCTTNICVQLSVN